MREDCSPPLEGLGEVDFLRRRGCSSGDFSNERRLFPSFGGARGGRFGLKPGILERIPNPYINVGVIDLNINEIYK